MDFFEIAARRFAVRAVYDEGGICQVMEKMRRVSREHQELASQMAALIYEEVPNNGPPEDPWRVGTLHGGLIYEFKAAEYLTAKKRKGLRIAWFFDGSFTIVCTNAFYKRAATERDQVRLALQERERYLLDKAANDLNRVTWP